MRKHATEWPLLLCLALPVLLLTLFAAGLWLKIQAQQWSQAREIALATEVAETLTSPPDWATEDALLRNLNQIPHHTAWLEDQERARVWHQGRPLQQRSFAQRLGALPAPILRWPLQTFFSLVIQASPMRPDERAHWRHKVGFALALCLLLTIVITSCGYLLVTHRWQQLLRWSRGLEQGSLDTPYSSGGFAGEIAAHVSIVARRLWYSRQTLNHFQQEIDVDQRAQIRQLREELEQLRSEQKSKRDQDATRSALLSSINHELRTPLTGILGFAELLEKSALNPEQREYVQTIRKSSSDMVGLISDFLDHQRADAGQLTLHLGQMDPAHVVEDTIALLAPLAYEKNLELTSIVDHDVPAPLNGDAARLRQILTNLVSNAIKFTQRGHVLIRLQRVDDDGDSLRLRLTVEDTGCGLSEAEQEQLFQAFQRFETDARPDAVGSGLGLSIVRQLTELLGGEIQVDSEPGKGARFSVLLPFEPVAGTRAAARWDALKGRRMLICEPQDMARRSLLHHLTFWGVHSETLHSLTSLKNRLTQLQAEDKPDLIVLGLDASQLDQTALRSICAAAHNLDIAVLGLVNSIDGACHRQLRELDLNQVLAKSIPRSSLYRSLGECLHTGEEAGRALDDCKILLAENNAASQLYLKSMLEQAGAAVHVCSDGELAAQLWQQHKPHFVLLDFNMPGLRGDEVTRHIREHDPSGSTVIIGMSAHLSPAEERQWYSAGLDSLLIKPFDQAQFLRCVHPWLDAPLQAASTESASGGARLVEDPELAAMMAEELPQQLRELDTAFVEGDWEAARAAAHQLHGTAAFFHLEPLKSHVFLLETRLNKDDAPGDNLQLRDDIINVTQDVSNILKTLPASESPAPPSNR